jgi:ADP-heptose:LPS heptosyltransferase
MSNILIIKHGSLGDIVQISGVLKDIREKHNNDNIFILTTYPYVALMSKCPFVDNLLVDRRLPRWNILYLLKLRKIVNKFNFSLAYDLQNSSRTLFYKKFLFNISNWSSASTMFKNETKKIDFEQDSVLERFKLQLDSSNVKSIHTLTPNFSWACLDVSRTISRFLSKKFIVIFPFSSPKLQHKQWPYYNRLIKIIRSNHQDLEIITAPGPNEIEEAKKIDAITITNNGKSLDIMQLAGLIKISQFVISNDTGPAHMAAHLGLNGVVLFGYHTTAKKVSIETKKFRAISVRDLKDLSPDEVYKSIKKKLDLIN